MAGINDGIRMATMYQLLARNLSSYPPTRLIQLPHDFTSAEIYLHKTENLTNGEVLQQVISTAFCILIFYVTVTAFSLQRRFH